MKRTLLGWHRLLAIGVARRHEVTVGIARDLLRLRRPAWRASGAARGFLRLRRPRSTASGAFGVSFVAGPARRLSTARRSSPVRVHPRPIRAVVAADMHRLRRVVPAGIEATGIRTERRRGKPRTARAEAAGVLLGIVVGHHIHATVAAGRQRRGLGCLKVPKTSEILPTPVDSLLETGHGHRRRRFLGMRTTAYPESRGRGFRLSLRGQQ